MQALWLEQGELRVRDDLPVPQPGPGEALVRVRLAGVCGTDLQLLRGYLSFVGVPGHEFVGEIAAAPDAPGRVGERVVGEINIGCGTCPQCRAGRGSHCEQRRVLGIRGQDGAFAEYLCLPLVNLHRVPDGVADAAAVFVEPLAAALAIPQQLQIRPDERVLLVGAGRLGQLIARVLGLSGCALAVVARHPRQRELLDVAGLAWVEEGAVPARAFDRVVEASGSPGGLALARRAVRPRGTLVLKSTYPEPVALDLAALVVDEVRLLGSRCGPFPPALRLLQRGLVDPLPLIDARYPRTRGVEALTHATQAGTLKVLVD